MLLYHGTSEWALKEAGVLEHGLQPREAHGMSNWEHTVESNSEAVYLTDTYACHYAANAWKNSPRIPDPVTHGISKRIAVIEIETSNLTQGRLHPDEDAIEQDSRGSDPYGKDVIKRTKIYRQLAKKSPDWQRSLRILGTCAYYGAILPRHFTRIAYFDRKQNMDMFNCMTDGVVSAMAFKICGHLHRNCIKWLFGEPIKPEDIAIGMDFDDERRAYWQAAIDNRAGIEIVTL